MADEADRLADVVSYTRDKVRLREQAETWRLKAQQMDAAVEPTSVRPASLRPSISKWWMRLSA